MANLESRLQELSETVGTYDRLRQNDQMSMQKLRDRIAQLDLENQSLQNVRRNDSLPGRLLKFIYSEKATELCEIFPLLLSYVVKSQK